MVNYQQVINYLSTTFQLLCHINCFNCEITTLYQIVIVATQKNRKRTPTVVKMRYHHQIYPCQNSRLKFVEQKNTSFSNMSDILHHRGTKICPVQLNSRSTAVLLGKEALHFRKALTMTKFGYCSSNDVLVSMLFKYISILSLTRSRQHQNKDIRQRKQKVAINCQNSVQ